MDAPVVDLNGHAASEYFLSLAVTQEQLAAVRACEASVFLSTYGNTEEQLHDEYGRYEDASVFVGVFDRAGTAVGAVRLIRPNSVGLKTLVDVGRPPWHVDGLAIARLVGMVPERTWDVATLAVRRGQARAGLIATALYHGMLRTLRANRARWIVMLMDSRARRLLDISGLRTDVLPGTKPAEYLGSPATVPLWGDFAAMLDGQRARNPDAYRLVGLGIGLDGIRVAPPDSFALRAVARQPDEVADLA